MTLYSRVNQLSIYDPLIDKNGRLVTHSINWVNQLTTEVNSVLKYGKDSLGITATNQKLVPFVQFPSITTQERNSVNGISNGSTIYNSDIDKLQYYANGIWVDVP